MRGKQFGLIILSSLMLGLSACGSSGAAGSGTSGETVSEEASAEETSSVTEDALSLGQTAAAAETAAPGETVGGETSVSAEADTETAAPSSDTEASPSEDTSPDGSTEDASADAAIAVRNETIYFTVDGTVLYLDETLNDLCSTGLSFTYYDSSTGTDVPVDEAFCATPWKRGTITVTVTDSSGNPVSVSLWNKWLDEEPETYGELNVMNIGIAEPAPVAWSQASTGPYGIYIGMPKSDLVAAAGKPESNTQFVKSPTWLYSGDNYSMTVSVSDGVVKGIWIDDTYKVRHAE